jgi:competence protein ComEC
LVSKKHRFAFLSASLLILFFGRSLTTLDNNAQQWVTGLHGDLVEIIGEVITSPVVKKPTIGEMSPFDHKEKKTHICVMATLKTKNTTHYKKTPVFVVCAGDTQAAVGDTVVCSGWLWNSNKQHNTTYLFITNSNAINIIKTSNNPETIKIKLQRALVFNLDTNEKTLANALFFGTRDSGWGKTAEIFRKSGLSHILAISGMHVAIFVLLITTTLSMFGFSRPVTTITTLTAVVSLLYFVEIRPPVIRAVVMVVFFLIVGAAKIKCNTTSILGAAAVCVLLLNPRDGGTAGFQLSFIVVASLCTLLPTIVWRTTKNTHSTGSPMPLVTRWFINAWLTTVCAWLISMPITTHIFGTFAPVGLFSNIPAVAILLLTIWAGAFSTTLYLAGIPSPAMQSVFSELLFLLNEIAEQFSQVPGGFLETKKLPWIVSATLFLCVVVWALKIKKRLRLYVLFPPVVFFVFFLSSLKHDNTVITTINVGHGTCHIIQNNQYTIMIDGGSRNNLDVGSNKIIPKLRELGVSFINTIVITHSDIDHIAGIMDVVDSVRVGKVLIAPQTYHQKTKPLEAVINKIKKTGIPIEIKSAGWEEANEHLSIKMVSPRLREETRSTNAISIVLLLETHNRHVLFTGDVDELKIIELTGALQNRIDVIEMPHHGQWSKEAQQLIHNKRPLAVLQSTNRSRFSTDRWLFPNDTARFVTATDGTITTTIKPNGDIVIIGEKDPVTMSPCLLHH